MRLIVGSTSFKSESMASALCSSDLVSMLYPSPYLFIEITSPPTTTQCADTAQCANIKLVNSALRRERSHSVTQHPRHVCAHVFLTFCIDLYTPMVIGMYCGNILQACVAGMCNLPR